MNTKAVFGFIVVIFFVVVASFFATNNLFQGSVFQEVPSNFTEAQQAANNAEKTPTDYAIQKLTVYEPPEVNTSAVSSIPNSDGEISEKGVTTGNLSKTTNSGESNMYYARAVIKNLGTTVAALPKNKVELNGTILSDVSGAVEFTKVSKNGLELVIKFGLNSPYIKSKGLNTLSIAIDPDGEIKESNLNNNTALVTF